MSQPFASKQAFIMRYPIAIEPRTEDTEYGVVIPDLPGCFSAGDTLEEAIEGAEEAGLAWIDAALDAGEPVPPPSTLEAIRAKPNRPAGFFARHHRPGRARRYGRTRQHHAAAPDLRRLDDEARAAGETRSGYIAKLTVSR